MPRPRDTRPLPEHPAVRGEPHIGRWLGRSRMIVEVQCPGCSEIFSRTLTEMRRNLSNPLYKGHCRPCSLAAMKAGTHRWAVRNSRPATNKAHKSGYILVYPREVSDDDLPMYRQMQRSGQPLLEHRWEMAKHLGRPLLSNESVDHMDGNRANNEIVNLRIYIKGKNQPGSTPGYGTYYDEWQRAEARVRALEAEIAALR